MRSLDYSPDGRSLIVATGDRVRRVDLERGTAIELARPQLLAMTMIDDELWSIGGAPPMLEIEGHAERLALPGSRGRLVRGPGQAVWIAHGGTAVQLVRTPTGIDAHPLPDADHVVPLGGTRMIAASRATIVLRTDSSAPRWSVSPVRDGRVTEGAAMFEGRVVALYVERRQLHGAIVVLDARTGAVQHRIDLRGATAVRFASRRGIALVTIERRELVVVDLRFGRVLATHAIARDIRDLAIDDSGQRIALRHGDDATDLSVLDTDELLRAQPAAEPVATVVAEVPLVVVADEPPPPAPAIPAPRELPAIPSLRACVAPVAPAPAQDRELFEAARALVVALISHAIARAWDEGRAAREGALPLRDLLHGTTGTLHGRAADDRVLAGARLDEAFVGWWTAVAAAAPAVAPLHRLADDHGLSDLEQHILLVIAAPALWGELARLYSLLANDPGRALCDELLVGDALATIAFAPAIAAALDPGAPLVRSGLVRVGGGPHRPFLALSVDPIVLATLRGAALHTALGPAIQPREATCAFADFHAPDPIKQHLVDELERARSPLRVVVRGRTGSGRHTLLAAIAQATGRTLGVIDAGALLRGPEPELDELEQVMQRAALAGLVPCLDGLERQTLQTPVVRDRLRAMIARHAGPVMVRLSSSAHAPVAPGHVMIDLPAQTTAERTATWIAALARAGVSIAEPEQLAARFALGPGVIERVVAHVAHDPGPQNLADRLELAIRQHLDSELASIATRVERLPTWSQVVLPPDIQDSITELIGRIRHRRTVFDTWGFDRVMSSSRGLTALFQGGPGTGKTLVAAAIANELGLDLYRVDVSRIMSKWLGETEANLAKLFDAAQDGNAILLFDEADSLFAKRTEVKSSNDRFANLEVNYLLTRLDSFEGIAILTTNFGTSIDQAFKRRLSFRLTFPFPDEDQREQLWRAHLPAQLPIRGELSLADISRRYQLSGGYIRNCALRAAFLAAEQGGTLTADHLERAIKAEFREIGKLSESGILE